MLSDTAVVTKDQFKAWLGGALLEEEARGSSMKGYQDMME